MKGQNGMTPLNIDHMVKELGCLDTAKRILVRFAEHTNSQIERLQEAIKTGRISEIHRISHSVKGGAMNIGADRLVETARLLEVDAKAEKIGNAKKHLIDIKKAFVDVEQYIYTITREN
ncbi:MAG: Hpt domain-containing protein [Spirochaetales bacterium]|nr:Hpt domain-containing protein [Spirochaetales bacterium]